MSENTETAQLMLETPKEITIGVVVNSRRGGASYKNGALRLDLPGFTLVGTQELLAVYRLPTKTEHWGLVHVPSGIPLHLKFRIREEAEDFGSWAYMNAVNPAGLFTTKRRPLQDALGARVHSRLQDGKLLRTGRIRRDMAVGTSKTLTDTEMLLQKRTAELRILMSETASKFDARITALNEKDVLARRALQDAVASRDAAKRCEVTATQCLDNVIGREVAIQAQERQLRFREGEAVIAENNVRYLRDSIIGALSQICTDAVQTPVERALRGIRIRGDVDYVAPEARPEAE